MNNMLSGLALALIICSTTLSAQTFTLTSTDVGGQATMEQVFNGFGCTGQNKSPQLAWANAPEGTRSYAVTVYDPDAPTGSGWWHWLVYDLPATTLELPTSAGNPELKLLPSGAKQGVTDFGAVGYGGPCPPVGHGAHRYIVTVYALDVATIGLNEAAAAPIVGFNLSHHTLARASLMFYYERK